MLNNVFGAQGDVSNARPTAYKAVALPAELRGQCRKWSPLQGSNLLPHAPKARALPVELNGEKG